ncbi:MAG TPA: efflux RND transporter periplasmic adaptor subunit [Oligoflexia bacterium]|nr:efflux RND transporter periplasmic adaptor subunit [Oligoflexia bacterium]
MNKKWLLVFLLVALVGATSWVFFKKVQPRERVKAKRGTVVESIYGLGTVVADHDFHLRTGVPVSVTKLFVSEGDKVEKGSPLVRIDENTMVSPIVGAVSTVAYKEGELAPAHAVIVSVMNLSKLHLEVSLEQQSVLRVKQGQNVVVSFESLRNERTEGIVKAIYPRENQFIVRIDLNSWPEGVLPGMTADTAILVGRKSDVILIPVRAIKAGLVTRVRNGKKEKLPVKLGVLDGEWAEVLSENVAESDELVVQK